jgi:hypothetical protein
MDFVHLLINVNVLFNSHLLEYTLDQLSTSGLTNKSIQSHGVGKATFIKAILNLGQSLHILYEVESSHNNNQHFSLNGQLMAGLQNGYAVQLHFININNIMPPNFTSLPYAQQSQILQQVFDNADVKVSCDCGSFYWQGLEEQDDKKDVSFYGFAGQPGTGKWQDKHIASGLPQQGLQICKHIWSVSEQLTQDIPAILKYLGSGATTSQATSTEQTEQLEIQEQPAGLPEQPKQGVPKETTINSEKAETTVSADIETIKSNNEIQNAPTLNTSEVEAKSDEAETEAQEGTDPAEPPIEKPTIPEELADKKEADKEKNVLEEPFDTQTKKTMNEQLVSPLRRLYEELFYRGYRNYPLFQGSELLPNNDSKILYLATDADHAFQFAMGQTTVGDEMVFEVYDIPIKELKIYNLQNDTKLNRNDENLPQTIKEMGYDGWTKIDSTVLQDDDDMPGHGRELSRTWELGLFDKNKYKPIDRVVSKDGDFTMEQLNYLLNKYDMQFLNQDILHKSYDDAFPADLDDHAWYMQQQEEENERKQELLSQNRAAQDAGQQNLFDDSLTKRQIKRKRMTYIAKKLEGYGDIKEFEKIWKELQEEGYATSEVSEVNRYVLDKLPKDISDGFDAGDWAKFNNALSDYLSEEEDRQLNESLLNESASYVGNCTEIGEGTNDILDSFYSDATELANDLGYYATFDDFEDPKDSNYEEISEMRFQLNCTIPIDFWKKKHKYLFLKRKDADIYIVYDETEDTHYLFC